MYYVPIYNLHYLPPGEFKYRTLTLKVLARYWLCMVFVIAMTWYGRDLTKSESTWLFCLKAPQSSGSLTLDWAQTLSQSKSRCAFHSPRWPPFISCSLQLQPVQHLSSLLQHWFALPCIGSAWEHLKVHFRLCTPLLYSESKIQCISIHFPALI